MSAQVLQTKKWYMIRMPLNLTTDKVLINHKPDHSGCCILMSCHALWQDQLWNIPISWQNPAVICKGSLPNAWSRSGALHTLQQCCVPIFLQYSNLSSRIERCFYMFPCSFFLVLIIIYDSGISSRLLLWQRPLPNQQIQDARAKPQGWSLVSSYTWNEVRCNVATSGWQFSTMFKFAEGLNKTSTTSLSGRVFDIIWYYHHLKVSGLHSCEIVCISHFLVLLFYAEWSCYQCLHHGWSMLKQRLHQFHLSSNHMSPYNQKQGFAWPLHFEPHVIMYEIKCLYAPLNHTYKCHIYIYIYMYI